MTAAPSVTAVILHWGSAAATARCLRSLGAASWPGPAAVLIVDNTGCLDQAAVSGAGPLEIEVVRPQRNLGFCEGSTLGMRMALDRGADLVLLLNNDVVVDPGFLDALVRAGRQVPDAGLLSPQIVHLQRPEKAWYLGGTFSLWSGIPAQGHGRRPLPLDAPPRDVDYATGCATLVHPSVLRRVGSFDPAFFAYCEDVDWSIRVRRAGLRVLVVPASVVYHDVANEPERACLRIYYSTRNLIEVMRKHAAWYHWPSFTVNFLLRWLGFFAALAVLRGQPQSLAALGRGVSDFARRRFGQSAWIDDARAERRTTALPS